jgi:hypothetical protein
MYNNWLQEQFNMFVLCIREEYAGKRNTFRKVIDAHKIELDKKEKYWNEMLQVLFLFVFIFIAFHITVFHNLTKVRSNKLLDLMTARRHRI